MVNAVDDLKTELTKAIQELSVLTQEHSSKNLVLSPRREVGNFNGARRLDGVDGTNTESCKAHRRVKEKTLLNLEEHKFD